MGLSASQARQLLLTAKRNDLEFRAQQISQQRLILSSQLEEIATEYENATSNRQMQVTLYSSIPDENGNVVTAKTTDNNLTYKALVSGCHKYLGNNSPLKQLDDGTENGHESYMNTAYILRDADERIVVSSYDEIPGLAGSETYKALTKGITPGDADSDTYTEENQDYKINYVKESGTIKIGTPQYEYDKETGELLSTTYVYEEYVVDPALRAGSTDEFGESSGPNYLQDCLRNGSYLLEKWSMVKNDAGQETGKVRKSGVSWDSAVGISDRYYTEDDDAAKAKYDRLQNEIQRQDKKLELELDNIETQRSAITTEEESVQKVMDDNIEGTFKTFA